MIITMLHNHESKQSRLLLRNSSAVSGRKSFLWSESDNEDVTDNV